MNTFGGSFRTIADVSSAGAAAVVIVPCPADFCSHTTAFVDVARSCLSFGIVAGDFLVDILFRSVTTSDVVLRRRRGGDIAEKLMCLIECFSLVCQVSSSRSHSSADGDRPAKAGHFYVGCSRRQRRASKRGATKPEYAR